jgi:hypothetical protein
MQTNNNAVSGFTLEAFNGAVSQANARWASKEGNEGKFSPDLSKALRFVDAQVIASTSAMLEAGKIDPVTVLQAVSERLPVKAIMRMSEFFNALSAGAYQRLDAVTCLAILSNAYAGAKSRDAITFAVTGKGDQHTSDQVKNIELVRKLQKVCSKVGASTEQTQVSRSFGKNGFCSPLGIGRIVSGELIEVNPKNVFFKKVAKLIDDASENTLQLMKGAKKKD